jgi:molybdopterin converting factor small subunit
LPIVVTTNHQPPTTNHQPPTTQAMPIRVELFGVARQRAGTAWVALPVEGATTVGSVLRQLAAQFPQWASECMESGELRPSYVVNVDGQRFVRDLQEPLADGTSLLVMSADAGG